MLRMLWQVEILSKEGWIIKDGRICLGEKEQIIPGREKRMCKDPEVWGTWEKYGQGTFDILLPDTCQFGANKTFIKIKKKR